MSYQIYSVKGNKSNLVLVEKHKRGFEEEEHLDVINGSFRLTRMGDKVVDHFGTVYEFVMNLPFKPSTEKGLIDYNKTLERVEQVLRTEGTT